MQLGFIGLGTMGRPMALHLMNGGHAMAVFARRAESTRPLAAAGAAVCPTPAAVAGRSEVVFTMVTGTRDVEQVLLGPEGVVHGARPGGLVIDMSTIDPTATRTIISLVGRCNIDATASPETPPANPAMRPQTMAGPATGPARTLAGMLTSGSEPNTASCTGSTPT